MSRTSTRKDTSFERLSCGAEGFTFGGQCISGSIFGRAAGGAIAIDTAIAGVIVGKQAQQTFLATVGGDGFTTRLSKGFGADGCIGPTGCARSCDGVGDTGVIGLGAVGVLCTGYVIANTATTGKYAPTCQIGVVRTLACFLWVTQFLATGQGAILIKADTNQIGNGGVTDGGFSQCRTLEVTGFSFFGNISRCTFSCTFQTDQFGSVVANITRFCGIVGFVTGFSIFFANEILIACILGVTVQPGGGGCITESLAGGCPRGGST